MNTQPPTHRPPIPLRIKLWLAQAAVMGALMMCLQWRLLPVTWEAPLLIVGVPLEIAFMVIVLRWSKRVRRIQRGLCASCGYDMRGTPQRCPECGDEFPGSVGSG